MEDVEAVEDVEAAQVASPARKRARTSKASEKNAAVSIKKSTTNLRTAKVVVADLETPAKTTPMATKMSKRRIPTARTDAFIGRQTTRASCRRSI